VYLLNMIPAEDENMTEWIIKDVFDYALGCGYVAANACDGLDLSEEFTEVSEKPQKGVISKISSIFKKDSPLPKDSKDTQDTKFSKDSQDSQNN